MEPATGRVFMPLGEPKPSTLIMKSDEQLHQISCPYCVMGMAIISVTHLKNEKTK